VDPRTCPITGVAGFLRAEHARGRKLVLATASGPHPRATVGHHIGLFDEVLASDGRNNLRGDRKGIILSERFGERGFDYAGNSAVDLPVWARARQAIVVNAAECLAAKAGQVSQVGKTFLEHPRWRPLLLRTLRPHQWVKNLIIFVPLLAARMVERRQIPRFALGVRRLQPLRVVGLRL
jgi:hypothetical protein